MFTPEEVLQLVKNKAEVYKGLKKDKKVSFGPLYDLSVKYKERILVHSDPDFFPEKLYMKRAPNQTDNELEYVRDNHKAITYPVFDRYQTAIGRIWNDANWSISSWGEIDTKFSEEQSSQVYFEENYPIFGSLEYFYKTIVTEIKSKDPNALIVHKPYEIPIKSNPDGSLVFSEDGEVIVDDGQMIEPIAFVYGCESVIAYRQGEYALVMTCENSVVQVGKNKERTGLIFEFYDENTIYHIKQVGEKSDYNFEVSVLWIHNLGYLPCSKLKGKPSYVKEELIYKSYFMPACEPLDIALLDHAYLLISKYRHAFPQKWEYITPCEYSHSEGGSCEKGFISISAEKKITCPSCRGSGVQRSMSPFHTIQMPMPDAFNGKESMVNPPFAGFITPDIETPEFLDRQIDKNLSRGLSILNLDKSNDSVKGGDTALKAQIDREEMFAFLLNVSSQMFGLFSFSLNTIQKMRYGTNATSPEVSEPKNFSIRTESDLTEEIAMAKAEGLPDVVLRQLIFEYLNTRFSNSDRANKIVDLVFATDRIVSLTTLEISQKILTGTVAKWEDILHTSIYMWIDDFIKNDPEFFDMEFDKQQEAIVFLAHQKDAEMNPSLINTDSVLASANGSSDQEQDIEAKAKAQLKGTVGGVQGILQIQASVAAGVTDYTAAITLLYEIYGFPDKTAKKLLGKPKKVISSAQQFAA